MGKVLEMPKVAHEVAEAELAKFFDLMDLDFDTSKMDEEDQGEFKVHTDRLITAIQEGSLIIDDKGQPCFTPTGDGNTITFHEPTGASLMAMDQKRGDRNVTKMFAFMADMTRTHESLFAKMAYRDLRVCLAITTLFMGG